MKRFPFIVVAGILMVALTSFYFVSCGGGGGDDIAVDQGPPPGGVGTGADSVVTFWYSYDRNVAFGAGNSVLETSDHGFIVAGSQSSDFASPLDIFVMKTDTAGTVQWKKRISETGSAMANAIRETSDGGYIVVGQVKTLAGDYDVYLLKIDASGNTAAGWPKTYGGTRDDFGHAVLPVSDGYILAGQRNEGPGSGIKVYIIRTDLAGSVIWEKFGEHFCVGPGEFGHAIAATPDGNIVIAGTTGCFGGRKGFLIKIDSLGNELWSKPYNAVPASSEILVSLATATDGFVLAGSRGLESGQPPVVGPLDALVIKTDANGNEIWRRTYGGAGRDEAQAVTITKDGNYMILGTTQSYGGQIIADPGGDFRFEDLFLIKVDANGSTLWQKVKGNRPTTSDHGGAVCAVSDGGFAVTGSSEGTVLLAKLDKNGDTISLGDTDLTISVPTGTTGTIKFDNAVEVAAAAVSGLTKPRQLGSTALDLLIDTVKNAPALSPFCSSGTYTFDPVPVAPLTSGTSTLTFTDCVTGPAGDQSTINGSVVLAVSEVLGDPLTTAPTYTVQMTLAPINLTLVDAVGTMTMTGGIRFQRFAPLSILSIEFRELAQSIDTQTFTWSDSSATANRTHVMGPFSVSADVSIRGTSVSGSVIDGSYNLGKTTDTLTVDPGLGPLTVTVVQPLNGVAIGTAPFTGEIKVTAPDGSSLTAMVTYDGTTTSAVLSVDTNGDGTVDGTISAPWDVLD